MTATWLNETDPFLVSIRATRCEPWNPPSNSTQQHLLDHAFTTDADVARPDNTKSKFFMLPNYHAGDLVITREHRTYRIGDVIAFEVPAGSPGAGLHVIHRIIARTPDGLYVTMGDNRDTVDPWQLAGSDVIGSVAVHVPYVGSVIRVLREPPVFAWFVGSLVLVGLWVVDRRRRGAAALRVP